MSDADDSAPAVWDPSARGGAGGWVRRPGLAQPDVHPEERAEEPADAAPTTALPLPREPEQDPQQAPWLQPAPWPQPGAQSQPRPTPEPIPMPTEADPQATRPHPVYRPTPVDVPRPAAEAPPGIQRPGRLVLVLIAAGVVVLLAALAVWGLGGGNSPHTASGHSTPPPVVSPTASAQASTSSSAAGSGSASASASASASTSTGASTGGPDGAAQATAVDRLLGQSVDFRQQVVDAVAAVQQCSSPGSVSSAQTQLTQAASERRSMVTQLDALDVSQVQGGEAAVQVLAKAWNESASADTAYAGWAGAMAMASGGCTPGNAPATADYNTAQSQSTLASADKNTFVDQWTPIAMQYSLPTRTADAI